MGIKRKQVLQTLFFEEKNNFFLVRLVLVAILVLSVQFSPALAQQGFKVTGKVTGSGMSMPGVNIVLKGTTTGVITNNDGQYTILVPDENAVLVFSYVGYLTEEIEVNGQSVIDMTLIEDIQSLDEVVVVGYGVQKKSVVTAAISQVDAEDLDMGNPTNIQNALKGKVSGVQITAESGQPGSNSKIRIRGVGTVNDSDPLYIIDGMPSSNGINYLDPSDIESIEILKDAASAAIYGARGANGVVLVTTKKGTKSTKTTFNYNVSYGIQNPVRRLDLMNSSEYQMIMNEMAENSGKDPYFPTASTVNTDWQDEMFYENAPVENHTLSLSGGEENSTYYASFGYLDHSGIMAKGYSNYERYNGRINYTRTLLDTKDRNWLNNIMMGSIVSYTESSSVGITANSESYGVISSMLLLPPTETVYQDDPDEIARYDLSYPNYVKSPDGRVYNIIDMNAITNPFAAMQVNNKAVTDNQIINANFNLDFSLLPGLHYKTTASMDWGFTSTKNVVPAYYLNSSNVNDNSRIEDFRSQSYNWQWENLLTYKKSFDRHNINLLAGTSMYAYEYSDLNASDYDLLTVTMDKAYIDIAAGDRNMERVSGGANEHKLASVFGRINYNFDEKYLLELVVRQDGSSNFSDKYKYATFPSVSLGWVLTSENFMANRPEWLDFAKLRASWGQNGNEAIGAFGYTSMMSIGYNAVVGTSGSEQIRTGAKTSGYVNKDLRWETSEQTDIGLDFRLFRGQVAFSTDYFVKNTKDMLLYVSLPEYTGFRSMSVNDGTVKNEGIEMEASYRLIVGSLSLGFGANASYVQNTVTDQGPGRVGLDILGGGLGGTVTWRESGKPYGFYYGYVTDGIFQNEKEIELYAKEDGTPKQPNARPGDVRYKDLDGVNGITEDDRTMLGDPNPDWTYGFSMTAEWKNFDCQVFFQGIQGNEIYKYYRRGNVTYGNWETSWLDRWHGEGTSDHMPRVVEGDPNSNTTWVSDLFVEDGSYLRLKVLQLGYQLPQSITQKVLINKLRIFVQGENLLTFTDYTGFDPEVGTRNGFDGGTYPQARTFTFGANITF